MITIETLENYKQTENELIKVCREWAYETIHIKRVYKNSTIKWLLLLKT